MNATTDQLHWSMTFLLQVRLPCLRWWEKKNSGDKGDKLSLSTSYSCMGHEEVTNGSTEMCLQQSDKLHYLSTMDIKDKRLARWSLININVWNNISKKHEEHIKPMIDY